MNFYSVTLYDSNGFHAARMEDIDGLKNAKSFARGYLKDPEYTDAHHVEIWNDACVCVWSKRK